MKKIYLVFLLFFTVLGVMEAQRMVKGTITDNSGSPVIGANVVVKGTTIGTITDVNGMYSLSVPEGTTMLVVSYTGFKTKEVNLGVSNMVDISLEEGVLLQEAVITALGISRGQKSLGYGVQSVTGDEITQSNTVSALEALSGKVAGLQAIKSSGNAGAPTRMVLRGAKTFNGNNEALLVIDGVRISNAENHSERSLAGVSNSNRGIDINPDDIESVSVLKGGAASALYGAEGANGVIMITTKKGKNSAGKLNIDFNSTARFSSYNKLPEFQNKYLQGVNGLYNGPATGQSLSWGPLADTMFWDGATTNPYDQNGNLVGASNPDARTKFSPYDKYDFFQGGSTYNNNISFSGGTELLNFRLSAGHLSENGITPLNNFKRTNIGGNMGSKLVNNKLNLNFRFNYINSGGQRTQQGSNISGLMLGLLRTPMSFDNSNGYGADAITRREAIYLPNGRQRNYRGGGGYDNPYWVVRNNPFNDNVNRLLGGISLSYEFHNWFTLGTNLGMDNYADNRVQSFEINSRSFPAGRIFDDTYLFRNLDLYFTASGKGALSNDFSLEYTLGSNLYESQLTNNYIQGDGFSFAGFPNLGNASTISTVRTLTNSKTLGFFGNASLGFRDYLFLNVTGRQDYLSSLVVPDEPVDLGQISVFYPSVSLGFVFSELVKIPKMDFGKLRLSYASIGAGAPAAYLTSTNFTVPPTTLTINDLNDGWTNGIGFPFKGAVTGFIKDNALGATDLVPSLANEIEGGLDLRFFNNRLNLDVSVYRRNVTNQIVTVPVSASTGFQRATINSGELETTGADISLNLVPIKTANFDWNLGFNFTKWKTFVLSISDDVDQIYLDGFTGSAVYNLAPEKDANGKIIRKFEYAQIYGGAWLRDNNGNLVIDDDPNSFYYGKPLADPLQRVLGNPNPDFLLGINNSFTYKNWNLAFLFDIKSGGDMWNGTRGALTFFGVSKETENRGEKKVFDGVNGRIDANGNIVITETKNTIETTLDQDWYTDNGGGFGIVAEDFIEDASYIRLRNIALTYTFPRNIAKLGLLRDASITLSGQNLWLSTKYTGIDPETSLVGSNSNGQGLDYFQGPNTKSYGVTLNLKF
ncbi:MAG: SusC/RagA family TonB-linked outer membrane protein [Saprospiraceae bacterium]|nr:SusC/RagA family TonB-linked outer membrane protein [Saprospiraceae bacterium]